MQPGANSSSCSTTSSNSSACRPKRRSPRSRSPPGCAWWASPSAPPRRPASKCAAPAAAALRPRPARTVRFPRLRGAVLPNGSALKIYATAKNEIGAYIEYRIGHGSFTKIQRCLAPGSKKPEPCE